MLNSNDPWDDYFYSSTLLPALKLLTVDLVRFVAAISLSIYWVMV